QRILTALILRLIQGFFNRSQICLKRFAGVRDRLGLWLVLHAGCYIVDLFSQIADAKYRLVSLRELVANLQQQILLLVEVCLRSVEARVLLDLETLSQGFAADRQFELIGSWRRPRTSSLACPQNHSGKRRCAFVP